MGRYRLTVALAIAEFVLRVGLCASVARAANVILNEYNAVDSTACLGSPICDPVLSKADSFWGVRTGNGGDWFEVVVIGDGLDMRGWEFVVVNRAGQVGEESFSIKLTSDDAWSNLRSGTIVTISERLRNNVDQYEPAVGRWWLNVRASPRTDGTYATVECISPACDPAVVNWKVSNNSTQITIKNAVWKRRWMILI